MKLRDTINKMPPCLGKETLLGIEAVSKAPQLAKSSVHPKRVPIQLCPNTKPSLKDSASSTNSYNHESFQSSCISVQLSKMKLDLTSLRSNQSVQITSRSAKENKSGDNKTVGGSSRKSERKCGKFIRVLSRMPVCKISDWKV